MIMIQSERKKFWLFKRGAAENSNKEKIFVLFLLWLSRIVTPSSVCNAEAAEAQGTRALGRRKGRTLPGLSLLFSSAFVSTSQRTKTQSSAPNLHFFPGLGNSWRATGTWRGVRSAPVTQRPPSCCFQPSTTKVTHPPRPAEQRGYLSAQIKADWTRRSLDVNQAPSSTGCVTCN